MKILIADGHQLLADALTQLVRENEAGSDVLHASSLDDAMEMVDRDGPVEIVLLDYELPGMNGADGISRFRGKYPTIPCAVFSGRDDADAASDALAGGADGVIPKDISAPAFFHALKLIQGGESFIPAHLYRDLKDSGQQIRKHRKTVKDFLAKTALTQREVEVLRSLTKGNSNRQIAAALGIEEVTIKLHLRRIYRKLGVARRTQAVRVALAAGLG